MQRLLLLGLNHSTAPLAVRERLAFNAQQRHAALSAFRARFPEAEAVLISTCNRVELYTARAVHGHPRAEEMIDFLAALRAVPAEQFRPHLYERSEEEAIEHLFAVSSSLDSMVLGETQILGQVREAYDAARDAGAVGPGLHPVFQRAIAVGKQVMKETAIAEGRMSVASVAVDYARQIFDHFNNKTVLSIGAGKMAVLVLQSFAALRPGRLLVCNRDADKAQSLARRFGGQAVGFDALDEHLSAADVVLSSTGAEHAIITRRLFESLLHRRRYRPAFLIDIALPRNIEPAVGELDNVYLYNLDDLQQVVSTTQSQRREALEAARAIIRRQVEQFESWQRAREMGPFIERLAQRYHALAREELERTINKLGRDISPAERAQLDELTRRIVNKLLHDPIQNLRQASGPGAGHNVQATYLHAMEKLFQLAPESEPPAGDEPASPGPPDEQAPN
jgi:glutamyl-tRNA reductase